MQQTACDEPIGRESFDPELTTEGLSRTEHRKQMTEDKGQTVVCLLSSDLCSLTSET